MKIAFVHFSKTKNAGDKLCCPHRYFDFSSHQCQIHDVLSWKQVDPVDMIIFGGGGMLHPQSDKAMLDIAQKSKQLNPNTKIVVWGAGSNYHHICHGHWPAWLQTFDLVGIRDRTNPFFYVPCPSCCQSEFQIHRPRPEHPFVIYYHSDFPFILPHPRLSNFETDDLKTILDFICSGHVLLTNSYHGAYWAMLMQKPVMVINAFSNRFFCGLPWNCVYADVRDYIEKSGYAILTVAPRLLLDDCKKLNVEFFERLLHEPTRTS